LHNIQESQKDNENMPNIVFNNFFSNLIKDRRPIVRENAQIQTENLIAKLSDREKVLTKKLSEIKN
jgi:hypothetical protein